MKDYLDNISLKSSQVERENKSFPGALLKSFAPIRFNRIFFILKIITIACAILQYFCMKSSECKFLAFFNSVKASNVGFPHFPCTKWHHNSTNPLLSFRIPWKCKSFPIKSLNRVQKVYLPSPQSLTKNMKLQKFISCTIERVYHKTQTSASGCESFNHKNKCDKYNSINKNFFMLC